MSRDDVLTRETQRLDRDDTVIRRRLRQKIEITTEKAAASVAPTEAQLQEYQDQHAEPFRGESRIAFAQIFLDPVQRGKRIEATATALLTLLNAHHCRVTSADFSKLGDRLFVLKPQYALTGQREIAASFGAA